MKSFKCMTCGANLNSSVEGWLLSIPGRGGAQILVNGEKVALKLNIILFLYYFFLNPYNCITQDTFLTRTFRWLLIVITFFLKKSIEVIAGVKNAILLYEWRKYDYVTLKFFKSQNRFYKSERRANFKNHVCEYKCIIFWLNNYKFPKDLTHFLCWYTWRSRGILFWDILTCELLYIKSGEDRRVCVCVCVWGGGGEVGGYTTYFSVNLHTSPQCSIHFGNLRSAQLLFSDKLWTSFSLSEFFLKPFCLPSPESSFNPEKRPRELAVI